MIFGSNGEAMNHIVNESSAESKSIIFEAAMYDTLSNDEIQAFLESTTEVNAALSEEIVTEKTIVRLDRKAQISQAKKASIFTLAREKNDPKMKKLMTIWRLERRLESELEKKYGNQAERLAKKTVDERRRSKSATVRRTTKSMDKSISSGLPTNRVK